MDAHKRTAPDDTGLAPKQPAFIAHTKYEEVAQRFENTYNQALGQINSRRRVIRAVLSVYYFARTKLHMLYDQPLSLEEFHVIRKQLREIAERAIAEADADTKLRLRSWLFRRLFGSAKSVKAWRYYMEQDHFPPYGVPGLPEWAEDVNSLRVWRFMFFEDFPIDYWTDNEFHIPSLFFPPNLQELETALLKESADAQRPEAAR